MNNETNWLNQDVVIQKIQSKINNLRNAAYIAEKGEKAIIVNDRESLEKYLEFKVKVEDYTKFADFLEKILLDIDLVKQEEVRQLEESYQDLREKIADICR